MLLYPLQFLVVLGFKETFILTILDAFILSLELLKFLSFLRELFNFLGFFKIYLLFALILTFLLSLPIAVTFPIIGLDLSFTTIPQFINIRFYVFKCSFISQLSWNTFDRTIPGEYFVEIFFQRAEFFIHLERSIEIDVDVLHHLKFWEWEWIVVTSGFTLWVLKLFNMVCNLVYLMRLHIIWLQLFFRLVSLMGIFLNIHTRIEMSIGLLVNIFSLRPSLIRLVLLSFLRVWDWQDLWEIYLTFSFISWVLPFVS